MPEIYKREILQVLEILEKYTSDERIKEMMHFLTRKFVRQSTMLLPLPPKRTKTFLALDHWNTENAM